MKSKLMAIAGGVVLVSTAGWAFSSQDNTLPIMSSGDKEILPIEQIVPMVEERYPGRITKVELEREHGAMVYEIKLVSPENGRRKLLLDAYTGEIVRDRAKD
ncbi:MAG: hypothetical protein Kow006_08790 [Gammaproteobacteria bacterium]